jgi:glycosyltransferase involved in cell wall biosynthesis
MSPVEISVVVPAYNEGSGLERALSAIVTVLGRGTDQWEILVVDDGSRDDTYRHLCRFAEREPRVKGLSFSRNFGKEAALLAGLRHARGRAVIVIDADLQHPPELIPDMIGAWRAGARIVHAVKRDRKTDGTAKRVSAWAVNQIISRMGGINIHNSSDYKLIDREIVDILAYQLPERERFFRGLSSWIGFREVYLEFDVPARLENTSKWSFWSLVELSITALTSFTSMPLRIITVLGIAAHVLGLGVATDALWSWYRGESVSGFATIIITLLLIGSFIMISLGIIGEYIAKIYEEIKARPPYLIQSRVGVGCDERERTAPPAAASDAVRSRSLHPTADTDGNMR